MLPVCVLVSILLASCEADATPLDVPTQTLIPSTATPTATPIQPSATPDNVLRASELGSQPTNTPAANALIATTLTPDADQVMGLREQLAGELGTTINLVQFVSVEPAVWANSDYGCQAPPHLEQAIPGYRYRFVVGDRVYEFHGTDDTLKLCATPERLSGELLALVDPVAAEFVMLAKRRIGEQLDLPVRRIMLVDAAPYTWTDTSLGCPAPNVRYRAAEINGYRIVVAVNDTEYIFHTDSVSLYPCDAAQEILPEAA